MVRVTACHAVGRGFEPRRSRQFSQKKMKGFAEDPSAVRSPV